MRRVAGVLRRLAWFAMATGVFGMAPDALAQTTMGNSGTGGTLWTSKGCGSCHLQTAAPINAANAGGHILYAIANGMPALATPMEANDLAAYLGTFLTAPVTVTVNQNSADNAIALPQLTLHTIRGQYTGIQVVTAPTRGSVTFNGTTASYTPFTGQTGTDGFTYQAITADGCTGSCSSVRSQNVNIVVPNPANNNFANRATLSGIAAHLIATNAGPTAKEAREPAHAGNVGGKSVWWTWAAPFTNTVTIQTSGSNFNTLLAVYTGSAVNALTLVASNNDCGASCSPANTSKVAFTATAGVTYQIAVDGFNVGSGAANGQVVLDLLQIPVLPNDNFAGAEVIPGGMTGASGNNTYATFEPGEPDVAFGGGGHTLWWRWTAPTTAIYRLATAGSNFTTAVGVYTGNSLAALTPVSFGTDLAYDMFSGTYYGTATFYATAGTEYWFQIDGINGQAGVIYFSLNKLGNDNFTQGLHVFGNEYHLVETNVGATTEGGETGIINSTVWFKWTAPSTAPVTIDTCGSAFESLSNVYTLPPFTLFPNSVGSLERVPFGYAQPICPDPQNYGSQFTAVAGTLYYIQLATASAFLTPPTAANNPGIYHLNIFQPPPVTYTGTAVSRKVHGSAGTYDLLLNAQSINGGIVIEPRSIGAGHVIAFAFSGTVYAHGMVTAEDAFAVPVGNVSAVDAGNEVLVTLSGIAEGQRVKVTVSGVNGVAGANVSLGFLLGDVTGTGAVNAADIAAVKARRGKPVSAAGNFRFDLDANGSIDDADVTRVKARSGIGLP